MALFGRGLWLAPFCGLMFVLLLVMVLFPILFSLSVVAEAPLAFWLSRIANWKGRRLGDKEIGSDHENHASGIGVG